MIVVSGEFTIVCFLFREISLTHYLVFFLLIGSWCFCLLLIIYAYVCLAKVVIVSVVSGEFTIVCSLFREISLRHYLVLFLLVSILPFYMSPRAHVAGDGFLECKLPWILLSASSIDGKTPFGRLQSYSGGVVARTWWILEGAFMFVDFGLVTCHSSTYSDI